LLRYSIADFSHESAAPADKLHEKMRNHLRFMLFGKTHWLHGKGFASLSAFEMSSIV
jgi:hypothetical protein